MYGGFNAALSPGSVGARIVCEYGQCDGFQSVLHGSDTNFHVVTSIENSGAVLDGFTIQNGKSGGSGTHEADGAGLLMLGGTLTIRHCRFQFNSGQPTVSMVVPRGGAIFVSESSGDATLTIEKTYFNDNGVDAGDSGSGGAIYNEAAELNMLNCGFENNYARGKGGAMANAVNGTSGENVTTLWNVLFYGNVSKGATGPAGGAIHNVGGEDLTLEIINCTFNLNVSDTGGTDAGGIASASNDEIVNITNSILWDNSDGDGTPGEEADQITGGDVTVAYSDVQRAGGAITGTGNINADPKFRCDAAGPARISGSINYPSEASPCRNAGDNTPVSWSEDLDARTRIVSTVDMGISEVQFGACCFQGDCTEETDFDCARMYVCDVNALHDGSSGYGSCGPSCCYGDMDGNGVVNAADRGFITAAIGLTDPELLCLYDLDGNGTIDAADRGFVTANIGLCTALPDWQDGSGIGASSECPDSRFQGLFGGNGTDCEETECEEEMFAEFFSGPEIAMQAAGGDWYTISVDPNGTELHGAAVFAVSAVNETILDDVSGGLSIVDLETLSLPWLPAAMYGNGNERRDMVVIETLPEWQTEEGGELCSVLLADEATLKLEAYVWRVNEDDSVDMWRAALTTE
jgi:hypothetical protein